MSPSQPTHSPLGHFRHHSHRKTIQEPSHSPIGHAAEFAGYSNTFIPHSPSKQVPILVIPLLIRPSAQYLPVWGFIHNSYDFSCQINNILVDGCCLIIHDDDFLIECQFNLTQP